MNLGVLKMSSLCCDTDLCNAKDAPGIVLQCSCAKSSLKSTLILPPYEINQEKKKSWVD